MAQAILADSNLRLVYEVGVNEKGEPIYKGKMYSNIQDNATAEQLHQASQALAALCNDVLSRIERNDRSEILA
jgi:hypothetical protein